MQQPHREIERLVEQISYLESANIYLKLKLRKQSSDCRAKCQQLEDKIASQQNEIAALMRLNQSLVTQNQQKAQEASRRPQPDDTRMDYLENALKGLRWGFQKREVDLKSKLKAHKDMVLSLNDSGQSVRLTLREVCESVCEDLTLLEQIVDNEEKNPYVGVCDKCAGLTNEVTELRERCQLLQGQEEELQTVVEQQEENIAQWQRLVEEMQADKQQLEDDLKEARAMVSRLEDSEGSELRMEEERWLEEEEKRGLVERYESAIEELSGQLIVVNEQNKLLQQQLREQRLQHDDNNNSNSQPESTSIFPSNLSTPGERLHTEEEILEMLRNGLQSLHDESLRTQQFGDLREREQLEKIAQLKEELCQQQAAYESKLHGLQAEYVVAQKQSATLAARLQEKIAMISECSLFAEEDHLSRCTKLVNSILEYRKQLAIQKELNEKLEEFLAMEESNSRAQEEQLQRLASSLAQSQTSPNNKRNNSSGAIQNSVRQGDRKISSNSPGKVVAGLGNSNNVNVVRDLRREVQSLQEQIASTHQSTEVKMMQQAQKIASLQAQLASEKRAFDQNVRRIELETENLRATSKEVIDGLRNEITALKTAAKTQLRESSAARVAGEKLIEEMQRELDVRREEFHALKDRKNRLEEQMQEATLSMEILLTAQGSETDENLPSNSPQVEITTEANWEVEDGKLMLQIKQLRGLLARLRLQLMESRSALSSDEGNLERQISSLQRDLVEQQSHHIEQLRLVEKSYEELIAEKDRALELHDAEIRRLQESLSLSVHEGQVRHLYSEEKLWNVIRNLAKLKTSYEAIVGRLEESLESQVQLLRQLEQQKVTNAAARNGSEESNGAHGNASYDVASGEQAREREATVLRIIQLTEEVHDLQEACRLSDDVNEILRLAAAQETSPATMTSQERSTDHDNDLLYAALQRQIQKVEAEASGLAQLTNAMADSSDGNGPKPSAEETARLTKQLAESLSKNFEMEQQLASAVADGEAQRLELEWRIRELESILDQVQEKNAFYEQILHHQLTTDENDQGPMGNSHQSRRNGDKASRNKNGHRSNNSINNNEFLAEDDYPDVDSHFVESFQHIEEQLKAQLQELKTQRQKELTPI